MRDVGRIAAISDEFSPDLETALDAMLASGIQAVELRTIGGRNLIHFTDDEIDRVRASIDRRKMVTVCLASPLLKSVLPDAPGLDPSLSRDVFGASHPFSDEPRLADRAFEIASRLGAGIVRVFSYWRTVEPASCEERVVTALKGLADRAVEHGLIVDLENEHACNAGTAEEAVRVLAAIDHQALGLVWDPANAQVLGEQAFPSGYQRLPIGRLVHVHAKNCRVRNGSPEWTHLTDGEVSWHEQIAALARDGYRGRISLETHWTGPNGDKIEASRISARTLHDLMESASRSYSRTV